MSFASRLFRPTRSNNNSAISAFVSVRSTFMGIPSTILSTRARTVLVYQRFQQHRHTLIDRRIIESGIGILQPESERKALFVACLRFVSPYVEQTNVPYDA